MRPVAGAGPIVSAERLASGRYNILVKGEWRLRFVRELPSDTLYRLMVAENLEDVEPVADVTPALERIRGACRRLLRALDRPANLLDTALAEGQAPGVIADRIAGAAIPSATLRQELLETVEVTQRLTRVAGALEALIAELRGERG